MVRLRFFLTAAGAVLAAPAIARGQETLNSAKAAYRLVTLSRGLEQPWGMAFLPDTYCGHSHPLHLSHHERAIAAGVAAGAAEIQLNLVAQDFLKLPREARA